MATVMANALVEDDIDYDFVEPIPKQRLHTVDDIQPDNEPDPITEIPEELLQYDVDLTDQDDIRIANQAFILWLASRMLGQPFTFPTPVTSPECTDHPDLFFPDEDAYPDPDEMVHKLDENGQPIPLRKRASRKRLKKGKLGKIKRDRYGNIKYKKNLRFKDRMEDEEWKALFYPLFIPALKAKKICSSCPIREMCLTASVADYQEYGIWGGVGKSGRWFIYKRFSALQDSYLSKKMRRATRNKWENMAQDYIDQSQSA